MVDTSTLGRTMYLCITLLKRLVLSLVCRSSREEPSVSRVPSINHVSILKYRLESHHSFYARLNPVDLLRVSMHSFISILSTLFSL
jgi:hypothetical protein